MWADRQAVDQREDAVEREAAWGPHEAPLCIYIYMYMYTCVYMYMTYIYIYIYIYICI